jgi:hypothetical protein
MSLVKTIDYSHANGQSVCQNEYNFLYHRDVIKVKTGIHDIDIFKWHEATLLCNKRNNIEIVLYYYSILDLLAGPKSWFCFGYGLCCIQISKYIYGEGEYCCQDPDPLLLL